MILAKSSANAPFGSNAKWLRRRNGIRSRWRFAFNCSFSSLLSSCFSSRNQLDFQSLRYTSTLIGGKMFIQIESVVRNGTRFPFIVVFVVASSSRICNISRFATASIHSFVTFSFRQFRLISSSVSIFGMGPARRLATITMKQCRAEAE